MSEFKLTKKQRADFFGNDRWPVLAGEGKPPVKVGYVHKLSSRLSFEVTRVHTKHGKWRLEYKVHDDREERFYLLPTARSLHTDELTGQVAEMPPEEEIGYTRNPRRVRADWARTVPPNVQHVIDMRGRLQHAQRPTSQSERDSQMRSVREQLHKAMKDLPPEAQIELLAGVERLIFEKQTEVKKAA